VSIRTKGVVEGIGQALAFGEQVVSPLVEGGRVRRYDVLSNDERRQQRRKAHLVCRGRKKDVKERGGATKHLEKSEKEQFGQFRSTALKESLYGKSRMMNWFKDNVIQAEYLNEPNLVGNIQSVVVSRQSHICLLLAVGAANIN